MAGGRGRGAAHDERRSDILTAVARVAAESGIAAVSQASVASRAGVSPGRVQYYFPTKDALLVAAFVTLNEAASARITALVGGDPDLAPPRLLLETVLTELIPYDETTRAHVQFRQAYTALALHHADVAAHLRGHYQRLHENDLAGLIRRDQRAGAVPDAVDAYGAAVALAALAEGLAYYVLIGVQAPDVARARLLADVATLYARSPSVPPSPGAT